MRIRSVLVRSRVRSAAVLAAALLSAHTSTPFAQSAPRPATPDGRWTPWLGCWQPDTARTSGGDDGATITCVVPVAGSSGADALSVVGGKIVLRRRLVTNGQSHPMDDGGCQGTESADWSASGRRVYRHAEYTCAGGLKGISTSILAMSSSGDWLEIENVRAGGGSIERVFRRRNVGQVRGLPKEIDSVLARRRLAVVTARAAAAAPIATDEIVDAVRHVDAAVVRMWLVESGQRFDLDGGQLASLERADLPTSVLQAVMGAGRQNDDAFTGDARRSADDYLRNNTAAVDAYAAGLAMRSSAQSATPSPNGCIPAGCFMQNTYNGYDAYSAYNGYASYPYAWYGYGVAPFGSYLISRPVIVVHGDGRRPVHGRPPVTHQPVSRSPAGRRP